MTNPFEIMNQYQPERLEAMSEGELIAAQRSVLFPHEQIKFDAGEGLRFTEGDSRDDFFDFTDKLIIGLQARSSTG